MTVNGPEFLENNQIPQRACYIRVITLEVERYSFSLVMAWDFYERSQGTNQRLRVFERLAIKLESILFRKSKTLVARGE